MADYFQRSVLKNLANFSRIYLYCSLFLIKLQAFTEHLLWLLLYFLHALSVEWGGVIPDQLKPAYNISANLLSTAQENYQVRNVGKLDCKIIQKKLNRFKLLKLQILHSKTIASLYNLCSETSEVYSEYVKHERWSFW